MRQITSVFISLVLTLPAMAQESINIQKPYRTSSLVGVVVDHTGSEMPGVVVKRISLAHNGSQDELVTDENGQFRFSRITRGKHSLQLSKPGWSTLYITVVIDKKAKGELKLTMIIAR